MQVRYVTLRNTSGERRRLPEGSSPLPKIWIAFRTCLPLLSDWRSTLACWDSLLFGQIQASEQSGWKDGKWFNLLRSGAKLFQLYCGKPALPALRKGFAAFYSSSRAGLPTKRVLAVLSRFFLPVILLASMTDGDVEKSMLPLYHPLGYFLCVPELYIFSALCDSTAHHRNSNRTQSETKKMQSDQQKRETILYLDC